MGPSKSVHPKLPKSDILYARRVNDLRNLEMITKSKEHKSQEASESALIFITGYLGAPIASIAREISGQRNMDILMLDEYIEKKDGRSIRRICMAGGEHGYRNLEYEAVKELVSGKQESGGSLCGKESGGLVVACGDGILYDDQTRDMILEHELIIAGEDMDIDQLWEGALKEENTWHAFMLFGSEEEKRAAFDAYIERQRTLFRQIRGRKKE